MSELKRLIQSNSWRWAGEFAVIVLGVLAALAVDGWVQDRADRQAEIAYLERLIDDLDWDLMEIESVSDSYESFDRGITGVLRQLGDPFAESVGHPVRLPDGTLLVPAPPPPPDLPVDSIPMAFAAAFGGMREFDHRRGTYDELISTGATRVLRDSDVRAAIASYYSAVDANLELHFMVLRTPLMEMMDYLRDEGYVLTDFLRIEEPLSVLRSMPELPVYLRARRANAAIGTFLALMVRAEAVALRERLEGELVELR